MGQQAIVDSLHTVEDAGGMSGPTYQNPYHALGNDKRFARSPGELYKATPIA